jgi:hypothetical protein
MKEATENASGSRGSRTSGEEKTGACPRSVITAHTTFLLACVERDQVMHRYPYKVREGFLPHAAFRTRRELVRWMGERGLAPGREIPEPWTFETIEVEGTYERVSHMSRRTFAAVGDGLEVGGSEATMVGVSRRLSNGDFVEAKITEARGIRQVHFLNPNVGDRTTFGREESRAELQEIPPSFQEEWMGTIRP